MGVFTPLFFAYYAVTEFIYYHYKYRYMYLYLMLSKQTNYTNLRQNLASILDESISDVFDQLRNRSVIIVTRQGKEDVAILAADELSNMLETLHLFRSPANAQKLLAAMERADAIANKAEVKSETLAELCQELDLE